MVQYADDLMIVEMDMMHNPPYIIDFAKVKLFSPPDFSEEVLQDSYQECLERFEHHWPLVQELLAALESYQIYYLDPTPSNIVCAAT